MKTRTLLLLSLFAASAAWAQQYRWVDDKGRIHYTDTPPPASAKSAERKNMRGNAVGEQDSYELTRAIQKAPVTLYTHTDCKEPCQMARDVLNKRGVPFKEVPVTTPQLFEELKRITGGEFAVPVMVVGSYTERNATPTAFNAALDAAGYPPAGVARPGNQAAPPPPVPAAKAPASR